MIVENGICYPDDRAAPIKVTGFFIHSDFIIDVKFSTGEWKKVDFSPLLNTPAFKPLSDLSCFKKVTLEYGTLNWMDGEIDIAPEYLFEKGVPLSIDSSCVAETAASYSSSPLTILPKPKQ